MHKFFLGKQLGLSCISCHLSKNHTTDVTTYLRSHPLQTIWEGGNIFFSPSATLGAFLYLYGRPHSSRMLATSYHTIEDGYLVVLPTD